MSVNSGFLVSLSNLGPWRQNLALAFKSMKLLQCKSREHHSLPMDVVKNQKSGSWRNFHISQSAETTHHRKTKYFKSINSKQNKWRKSDNK